MRSLTSHRVNAANDTLRIDVMDEPGSGGAHHAYHIEGFDTSKNPTAALAGVKIDIGGMPVFFQNGPIAEVGVNGVTHEALLAILIDRLECFQAGPYACAENAAALAALRVALDVLHSRTRARMARGVEGTHRR